MKKFFEDLFGITAKKVARAAKAETQRLTKIREDEIKTEAQRLTKILEDEAETRARHLAEFRKSEARYFAEMMAKLLIIENNHNYWTLIRSKFSGATLVDNYDEGLAKVESGNHDFVITDLFMPGPKSAVESLKGLLVSTNPQKTRWGKYNNKNVEDAVTGSELPMGLLIAQKCKELNIPVVVATDSDHHGGGHGGGDNNNPAYLPIGCVCTMLDVDLRGNVSFQGGLVDKLEYELKETKNSQKYWERVRERMECVKKER